jgi:glutaredoxin 3
MPDPATTPRVRVFTKDHCRHCVSAKSLLSRLAVPFVEVDLTGDVDSQVELARRTGQMTLPQIEVAGHNIGGFNELEQAARDGRLEQLLASA